MRITELKIGDKAQLLDFGDTDIQYRRKLLALGMTRGAEFTIVRVAPLGCPIQIEIRGTFLTVRKDEAIHLVLERL